MDTFILIAAYYYLDRKEEINIKFHVMIITLIFIFSGCYDSKEIDKLGYVIAIGLDKSENDQTLYTFQIAKPLALSSGGEGGGNEESAAVSNVSVEAPGFYIALNLLNNFISKEINLSHTKIILFSSEVAQSGIDEYIKIFAENPQIRPDVQLGISLDKSGELLRKVNPPLENNVTRYYDLLSTKGYTAYGITKTLHEFSIDSENNIGAAVIPLFAASSYKDSKEFKEPHIIINDYYPVVEYKAGEIREVSDGGIESIGMAVFDDCKMVSSLNGDDVLIYKIITGNISIVNMAVIDKSNNLVSFTVKQERQPTLRVTLDKEYLHESLMPSDNSKVVSIKVIPHLKADISSLSNPEIFKNVSELEHYINNIIVGRIEGFFDKTKELNLDIAQFGKIYKRSFLTNDDWEKADWKNSYEYANFDIRLDMKISKSGKVANL